MQFQSNNPQSGATLIEILIASSVFIVVLILSLGAATEFSDYGKQADADAGIQLDCHRAFSRVESILRQGWTTPVISSDGTSVEVEVLGYEYDSVNETWQRIDPATWKRQYDTSTASYYFVDGDGFELPVANCLVEWQRNSTDPNSSDYYFGKLICTLSDGGVNSTMWTLSENLGTFETHENGDRKNAFEFILSGKSIEVRLHMQRDENEVPYSIRSRIQQRNFLDGQ
ncbi:MAG TPA: hypothetical protein DGU45_07995 [Planctomycetes bacterium]|nr:hypothetical protein [Planctomycetota bacterium]